MSDGIGVLACSITCGTWRKSHVYILILMSLQQRKFVYFFLRMDEKSVCSVYYENSYQFDKRNTNKKIVLHKKLHICIFSFTNIYIQIFLN